MVNGIDGKRERIETSPSADQEKEKRRVPLLDILWHWLLRGQVHIQLAI